jgi:CRP-like cAMP-binding protein
MELFADLDPHQLEALLGTARRRVYQPGDTLIAQGRPQRSILVLRTGTGRVYHDYMGHRVPVNDVVPGEVLGEVSFLDGAPASASVVAVDRVEADVLDGETIDRMLEERPEFAGAFYRALALALARRLRHNTDRQIVLPFSAG